VEVDVIAVAKGSAGVWRGRVSVPKAKTPPAREMKRYQSLWRAHALLHEAHALPKTIETRLVDTPEGKRPFFRTSSIGFVQPH
jgi:hypothetical protein